MGNKNQRGQNAPPSNSSGSSPATNRASFGAVRRTASNHEDKGFSKSRLEVLFNKYKETGDDVIGPAGIEKFCADLGVDPEDVVVLVFAWKINASEMGYFHKEEFVKGLEGMGIDSIDKIKTQLPRLKSELEDQNKFKEIFKFAFTFAKEKEQKCLDLELARGMLSLLMETRYPLVKSFLEFLKEQETYKVVNQDQWMSLLEFCKTIKADFSNYDENGAWPCILDEWVGWAKEGKSPK